MKLESHGTVTISDRIIARRTAASNWQVSYKGGSMIGECALLSEVDALIESKREAARARVEIADARATAMRREAEDDFTEYSMRQGELGCPDYRD
jgi:hypothetical protein